MKNGGKGELSKVDISVKYICNQLTDPFFVSDANFNIIYANDSFQKMVGKKPIGKKCYKLIHELDKFVKGGAYETAVKTKKAAIIELFEPRLKKWLMIMATPVPKKGKLVVCTQHIKDITERKETEKEFEMLSSVIKQSTEGMAVADLKGNIIFANEAWSSMHGYKSPKELFGKNLSIFHNKEQIEKEVTPFNKKVIELGAFSGEVWHITKDGKPFPTLMATSLLKDEQGKPYAIAGIAMNITGRKKDEKDLKESEERYRTLYTTSADAIMTLEPPTWKFTSGNPSTVRMFKTKDEKQFVSLGPWEVSPEKQPDGRLSSEKAKAMIMKAMKEGSNFFEWMHKRYKGGDFPATVLLTRTEVEGKQFLQATVKDITELKEKEKELAKMEKEMEIILDSVPAFIFYKDTENRFIRINKTLADVMEISKEKFSEKSLFDLYPKAQAEKYWKDDREVIASNKPKLNIIEQMKFPKGVMWVKTDKMPYKDETGKTTGIIGFAVDITELRKSGEEQKKNIRDIEAERKKTKNYLDVAGMILALDSSGRVSLINKEGCKVTGYGEQEIIGKDWFRTCIPQNERERVKKVFKDITAGKNQFAEYHENKIISKNGNQKDILWHNAPIRDEDGRITGSLSSGMELTETRKAEKEMKRHMQELETFKEFAVNRELKMIELKDRIKKLEQAAGK